MSSKNRSESIQNMLNDGPTYRILITHLSSTTTFNEAIERGRPFFTEKELTQIEEEKYPEGMTWTEIEKEVSKKGMILKKPTFRKYVKQGWIPRPKKDQEKYGSELKYPSTIIRGINLVKFLLSEDGEKIRGLFDVLMPMSENGYTEINLYEMLSDKVNKYELIENAEIAIFDYLTLGNPTIESAIEDIKKNYNTEKNNKHIQYIEERLERIENNFKEYVEKEIDELIKYTEENYMLIDAESTYITALKNF